MPRTVYVSTRASRDGVDGWTKVSRTLPRAATAQHLYEVSMSEDSYVRSAEVRGWDADKDVVGVYHSHYSPLVKAAVQLGCCAVVQRGTRRRAPQEGFDLGEVKMSARETKYLAIADIEAQESAAATPLKQIVVYAAGSGTRGVLAAFAGWHKSALLLLVRPRGSALNDQARASLAAHPLASEEGYDLTLDTVDSWAAGYARLQRLLPALQAAAKAPLVALAQTDVGLPGSTSGCRRSTSCRAWRCRTTAPTAAGTSGCCSAPRGSRWRSTSRSAAARRWRRGGRAASGSRATPSCRSACWGRATATRRSSPAT